MKVLLALVFLLWLGADAHHVPGHEFHDALENSPDHPLEHPRHPSPLQANGLHPHPVSGHEFHDALENSPHHPLEHVLRHHNPEHRLRLPWIPNQTHSYQLTINMTVGVPGMTSQVAKSVIQMEVQIRSLSETEYLLKGDNVFVSRPSASAPSSDADVPMSRDEELEKELTIPISFVYEDGEVTKYTMDKSDGFRSRSIKRGILRHFEMKIHPDAMSPPEGEDHPELYPIVYNTTECNILGSHKVYYGITVSPYPWFPYESNVFNVSKTFDFEPYHYPSLHEHNNFAGQGCPNLCKLGSEPTYNRYGSGCPGEFEPNKTPIKASLVVHHNYYPLRQRMIIQSVEVEELSLANMYDQDIEIYLQSKYELTGVTDWPIPTPKEEEQEEYTSLTIVPTLDDLKIIQVRSLDEISKEYQWIYGVFGNIQARDILRMAEETLEKVSTSVLLGNIESTRGQEVPQDVSQLQDLLSLLTEVNLQTLWRKIVDVKSLRNASEKEKIRRQIFLDVLPLSGTGESIAFIKYLITEKKLLTLEAKEVLEALPANIIEPKERNIKVISDLLELEQVKRSHVLHSAAYLTLSKVIRQACIIPLFNPQDNYVGEDPSSSSDLLEQSMKHHSLPKKPSYFSWYGDKDDDNEEDVFGSKTKKCEPRNVEGQCKMETVQKFLQDMRTKLKSETELQKKMVYMMAIAHLGYNESLEILKPYVYGEAEDIVDLDPADVDFIKTAVIYSLHVVAQFYPSKTLEIVAPVYFNRTEVPRVRIAAFSVLLQCQPSLPILQHVVLDTWDEPSNEVGSYVYSSLETYGNSSTPCMKLTADRIKLVIAQAKKYDIGWQHSKSIIKNFFDELRNFGLEKTIALVHSNETFVPSSIFSSLQYNIQSMKDVLFMFGANTQGVTLKDLFEYIDSKVMKLPLPETLSERTEKELFESLRLLPRLPKDFRITIYRKIFYASSFQYFSKENFEDTLLSVIEYLQAYFYGNEDSCRGYYVKTFIPGYIHSVTYSSIGTPLDFRMKRPIVLSLEVNLQKRQGPSTIGVSGYVKPSAYYATYHTKTIMNTLQGYAHGVYQENKYTFSLPRVDVELLVSYDKDEDFGEVEVKYKLRNVPKQIFRHHSEAGTFVTELDLEKVFKGDVRKEPIKTTPILFKRERVVSVIGLPPVSLVYHSEDIQGNLFDMPLDLEDLVQQGLEAIMNPGWRRRDINATIVSGTSSPANEGTFKISLNRTLYIVEEKQSSDRLADLSELRSNRFWFRSAANYDSPIVNDEDKKATLKRIYQKIRVSDVEEEEETSKMLHELSIRMGTNVNVAELTVQYNRTLDKRLHQLRAYGETRTASRTTPYKIFLNYAMGFTESPNEFQYDLTNYMGDVGVFGCEISFGDRRTRTEDNDVFALGLFYKVPSQDLFDPEEFSERPDPKYFVPKTHEECMRDISEGKTQSPACIAAVFEESHLNMFAVGVEARRDLPPVLLNITYKLERAIQHYYFKHVDVDRVNVQNNPRTFSMSMKYKEKLTDEPVLDILMMKPDENVLYRAIDPEYLQPLSSVFTLPESYILRATNNTYLPSCGLMESYIRTYDMKTYPLPRDTCTYVLSTHCTEEKTFAVLAKRIPGSEDTKEITLQLAEHKVVLKPGKSRDSYTIYYNEKTLEVTTETSPLLLNKEDWLYVHLVPAFRHQNRFILEVEAERVGIKIRYDGKNTKLQVHPFYKGSLCGLCSEFDGELTREYRGPDQCWYLESEDFAHSSIVDSLKCRVSREPKSAAICPSGEYSESSSFSTPSSYEPRYPYRPYDEDSDDTRDERRRSQPTERTVNVERRSYVCFSTQSVPVCDEGSRPEKEYLINVNYHCLPKSDITTRRLINESKYRVLRELANKKVDFTEPTSAAESCTPY